ncbi:hypothetical protein NMY22_g13419 [Coprinellus aureogranulatus]|nr:hypothetical protein NMY22_g13419 [Coprinellus aureogranulatus]
MITLIPARCHCARNQFKIPFDGSSLPRSGIMCHCNTCRHSTGSMGYYNVRIDGPQVPLSAESTDENHIPADLSNLTVYRASATAERYYCSTCSAHMFFRWQSEAEGTDRWGIMTGCLDRIDGVVTLAQHEFVGDTLDGGLADHIPSYEGKILKRYQDGDPETSEELPIGWNVGKGRNPETLSLHCHCKGVQLYLTRATRKVKDNDIWVVPGKEPSDPIRFMATHCLCNDCRLASGHEITTWLVVSDENIIDAATNAPVDLQNPEKRPKGLKQYVSSEGHHRESCKTCGASVFWWRHMEGGETPHMDVAAGLIGQDAAGGARAESWFAWEVREPSFAEYALSKETARALKDGWKAHVASNAE